MREDTWRYWQDIAQAAEKVADKLDFRDRTAVMAAYRMVDSVLEGRGIPERTPELNERLAHAEALARRA